MVEMEIFLDLSTSKSLMFYMENRELIQAWFSDITIDKSEKITLLSKVLEIITSNNLFDDFKLFEEEIKRITSVNDNDQPDIPDENLINYIYLDAARCSYENKKHLKSLYYLQHNKSKDSTQKKTKYLYLSYNINFILKVNFIVSILALIGYFLSLFTDSNTIKPVFLTTVYILALIELCLIFYNQSLSEKIKKE